MSKLRIYSSKENTIQSGTNYENLNASQESVFNLVYGGGIDTGGSSNGRNSTSKHLVYFDLADLTNKYSDKTINSALTTTYTLKYVNAIPSDVMLEPNYVYDVLSKSVASSFDLIAFPIPQFWDEGKGSDLESGFITFKNAPTTLTGYSNWLSATSQTAWSEPGIYNNPSASTSFISTQHFSLGSEDISLDVTDIVKNWLSGGSTNFGIAISYSRPFELVSSDTRYISSFFTNKINSSGKPYLEVNYDQTIRDDRNQVTNNRTSRLFLYLFSGNQATNYYSAGTVSIKTNANVVVYSGLTPSHHSLGCYFVDILMSGASKSQRYKDVWEDVTFVPGIDQTDFINTFDIKDNYYNNINKRVNDYTVDIYGIPNNTSIISGEIYRIYADARTSFSTQRPVTDFGLEYRLSMGVVDELVPWTAMNSVIIDGCQSCYFDLDTSWLLNAQIYKIEFRISEFGTKRLLPDTLTFKVINPI